VQHQHQQMQSQRKLLLPFKPPRFVELDRISGACSKQSPFNWATRGSWGKIQRARGHFSPPGHRRHFRRAAGGFRDHGRDWRLGTQIRYSAHYAARAGSRESGSGLAPRPQTLPRPAAALVPCKCK
jgi:hypothetical protein